MLRCTAASEGSPSYFVRLRLRLATTPLTVDVGPVGPSNLGWNTGGGTNLLNFQSGTLIGFNSGVWNVVLAEGERFDLTGATVGSDGSTAFLTGMFTVPEPATAGILAMAAAVLLTKRRRSARR